MTHADRPRDPRGRTPPSHRRAPPRETRERRSAGGRARQVLSLLLAPVSARARLARPLLAGLIGTAVVAAIAVAAAGEGRAQTCTSYTVTVLQGDASFVSRFLYRSAGGASQSLGLDSGDVGSSRTFTTSQSVQFGIFVVDSDEESWNARTSGQEIWFEDWTDDDYDDAGLRVVTSACSPPPPPPPPPPVDTSDRSTDGGSEALQLGAVETQNDGDDETPRDDSGETPAEEDDEAPRDDSGETPAEDGDETPGNEEQKKRGDGGEEQPGDTTGKTQPENNADTRSTGQRDDTRPTRSGDAAGTSPGDGADSTKETPSKQDVSDDPPADGQPETSDTESARTTVTPEQPVTGHGVPGLPPPQRLTAPH